ncbi:MAG: pilus assembly protein [Rhodobiaceae bacterium]|nr:pilus assembly protein [Rhodobiaceae bacterium]
MTYTLARRIVRDKRGTTTLEFAMVIPVFLLFLFGVVEFGRGLEMYNEMASAASSVSRIAMLDDSVSNASLETTIRNRLAGFTEADLQVGFSTETVSGIPYRVINISYPLHFVTPFLDMVNITLATRSRTPLSS